jgi:hypothetical protein
MRLNNINVTQIHLSKTVRLYSQQGSFLRELLCADKHARGYKRAVCTQPEGGAAGGMCFTSVGGELSCSRCE